MTFRDLNRALVVRDSIWDPKRSAAAFVGSGFSLFAKTLNPQIPKLPTGGSLAADLRSQISDSSVHDADESILGTNPPDYELSLVAQRFERERGRSELNRFLRQAISDDDREPGDLHRRLLELPWLDVFSTNWDSLLERQALSNTEIEWGIVRHQDEVPLLIRPRIVKLHGSLPSQFPLIVTENDYSTYRDRFAGFFNTVRQAMLESTFVLLGFSGDDPNFRRWKEWVQATLESSSQRIYLAGYLQLDDDRRKELERDGILPIDVALHPSARSWPPELKHERAMQWLLRTFAHGRPYNQSNWPSPIRLKCDQPPDDLLPIPKLEAAIPIDESKSLATAEGDGRSIEIDEVVAALRHNRKIYPGWLVFPTTPHRGQFRRMTARLESSILPRLAGLSDLDRLDAAFEIAWRRSIACERLSEALEAELEHTLPAALKCFPGADEPTAMEDRWAAKRRKWAFMANELAVESRFQLNERESDRHLQALRGAFNQTGGDWDVVHYEECKQKLWLLDFAEASRIVDGWEIGSEDPIWKLRKGSVLAELGRFAEAAELARESLSDTRSRFGREMDFARATREAWAMCSLVQPGESWIEFNNGWDELAKFKSDAWLEIDRVKRRLADSIPPEGSWEPGSDGTLGSQRRALRRDRRIEAFRAIRMLEEVGLPLFVKPQEGIPIAVASEVWQSAGEALSDSDPELAIRIALRACSHNWDMALERVLADENVKALSEQAANRVATKCIETIEFGLAQESDSGQDRIAEFWVYRIRVAMTVLSRVLFRSNDEDCERALVLGLDCYRRPEIWNERFVAIALGNVLRSAWRSMPIERRERRIFELLAAPVAGVNGFAPIAGISYPDPAFIVRFGDLPSTGKHAFDDQLDQVITLLVKGLAAGGDSRIRSLQRLLLITERWELPPDQAKLIARAIWEDDQYTSDILPNPTAYRDWMLMMLPQPAPRVAEKFFREKWLSPVTGSEELPVPWGVLDQVSDAISELGKRDQEFRLSGRERRFIARVLEKWALDRDYRSDPSTETCTLNDIGVILSTLVVPESVAYKIWLKARYLAIGEVPPYAIVCGLLKSLPGKSEGIARWCEQGLISGDERFAASAMKAVGEWISNSNGNGKTPSPFKGLSEMVSLSLTARSKKVVAEALRILVWIVNNGSSDHWKHVSPHVEDGLIHLHQQLWGCGRSTSDVGDANSTIIQQGAMLAEAMESRGYADSSIVAKWVRLKV